MYMYVCRKIKISTDLTAALGVPVLLHALLHKLHNFIGGVNIKQSITGEQKELVVFRYGGNLQEELI